MYKCQRFVRQFQHGSRPVVNSGHLAVLHHLTNAITTSRSGVNSGLRLNEVAAQTQTHQTCGRLYVEHTRLHLGGWKQKRVRLLTL